MYPEKQRFLVLGLSRSGKAAAEYLLKRKSSVYIYDDLSGERVEQTALELVRLGAKRVKEEDLLKVTELCDVLVLSPGIPIDHSVAVAFKRAGKAVVGETELAARFIKAPIIAVTGTNGKTTTVSMLAQVLTKSGYNAAACGNIGEPMINFCDMDNNAVAVAEISSFQLETLNSLCPHIAVILNVTEDHLNRHYNMENYIFLKKKLLKNSSEAEYAVLNYDDAIVRKFSENIKAQTIFFSVQERVKGAFYENGNLYFGKEKIMSASELPTNGLHNVQNALAVIAAAKIMGVKNEDIASGLSDFKGIKHRIELVGKYNGITYIDDSKGTNVDATLKAIATLNEETVLLLGGKNKGYDYGKLFQALIHSNVKHAILYGENRYALLKKAMEYSYEKVTVCENFSFAVRVAALKAEAGQTVLLSPASASFDEFASYEERGDKFVEIVQSIYESDTKESQIEKKAEASVFGLGGQRESSRELQEDNDDFDNRSGEESQGMEENELE